MRRDAPDAAACDRCHAPLRAVLPAADLAARDGVTCEVCHRLASATPAPGGGPLDLDLADKRMRGLNCDGDAPYFHRIECAPQLAESAVCGACHWLEQPVPTFTAFAEWQHGALSAMDCQDCHMSGPPGPVASGAKTRARVPDHGPAIPGAAIVWQVRGHAAPGEIRVDVALHNAAAAHSVPAGPPGRSLELRVDVFDSHGTLLGSDARGYRRLLVDAAGAEVPFYAATREAEDTRLRQGETRDEVLVVPGRFAGEVRVHVTLDLHPLSPAIAARLAVPAPSPTRVREETLRLQVRPAKP